MLGLNVFLQVFKSQIRIAGHTFHFCLEFVHETMVFAASLGPARTKLVRLASQRYFLGKAIRTWLRPMVQLREEICTQTL